MGFAYKEKVTHEVLRKIPEEMYFNQMFPIESIGLKVLTTVVRNDGVIIENRVKILKSSFKDNLHW